MFRTIQNLKRFLAARASVVGSILLVGVFLSMALSYTPASAQTVTPRCTRFFFFDMCTCPSGYTLQGNQCVANTPPPSQQTTQTSGSGTVDNGTLWSSTVGWVDISGTGHNDGVAITNGTLSGAGWSSLVGWVNFNANGCGSQGQVNSSGQVSGWAAVPSINGCINLGSTGHGDGVTLSNGTLSGNVWGGNIVGWMQINGTVNVSCTPSYTCQGSNSVYTNSQCQQSTTPCPGGCDAQTGQCKSCTPSYTCNGNTSVYTNSQCQQTNTDCAAMGGTCSSGQCVCTPGYTCVNGNSVYTSNQCQKFTTQCQNGCDQTTGFCINKGNQNGCLSTQQWPNCVKTGRADAGANMPLYWHTTLQNILSCTLLGSDGESYTLPHVAQGSQSVGPVTKDTQYSIVCTGGNSQEFTDSLIITLVPKVIEK